MGLLFFPRGGSSHVARNLARALPAAGWDATILSGSVTLPGRPGDAGRFYAGLDVRYTYRVDGVDYAGERLAFAPRWLGSRYIVDPLARRYAAGNTVDVRYDPDRPDESVLETDPQLATQRLPPVWICLSTVVVGVAIMAAQRLLD